MTAHQVLSWLPRIALGYPASPGWQEACEWYRTHHLHEKTSKRSDPLADWATCARVLYVAAWLAAARGDHELALRAARDGRAHPKHLHAAQGDLELAALATQAGLSVEETRRYAADPTLDRNGLRLLAGLRADEDTMPI